METRLNQKLLFNRYGPFGVFFFAYRNWARNQDTGRSLRKNKPEINSAPKNRDQDAQPEMASAAPQLLSTIRLTNTRKNNRCFFILLNLNCRFKECTSLNDDNGCDDFAGFYNPILRIH